jgi:hypothetical protein
MRVYWIEKDGVKYPFIHISTFSSASSLSITTIRGLIGREKVEGTKRRGLKFFRDGSTLWIPLSELSGYPFCKGPNVYHIQNSVRTLCPTCTFTSSLCPAAQAAEDFEPPVGDP